METKLNQSLVILDSISSLTGMWIYNINIGFANELVWYKQINQSN